MTRSGRPRRFGGFRARAAAVAGLGGVAALSVAACLADLPAADPLLAAGSDAGSLDAGVAEAGCGDGIIQRDLGEACDPGSDASAAVGCQSCAVVCPAGGFVGPNDHCYFALDAGHVAMTTASDDCAGQGAHVLTFDGTEEEAWVDTSFGDGGGAYWMALTEDMPTSAKAPIYDVGSINEPGWRSTCAGCYGPTFSGSATSFLNFCKANLAIGPCVVHGPSSEALVGATCDGLCGDAGAIVHAVCEREPAGLTGQGCDDGGVCISLAGLPSTYELVLTQLTRADAATACAAKRGPNDQPGHLVVFQTANERAQLSRELSGRTQAGFPELSYWVGLQNVSKTTVDDWAWEDGNPATAYELEWADGEPTAGYVLAFGVVANSAAASSFDRELIKTQVDDQTTRFFVCEFDGTDG